MSQKIKEFQFPTNGKALLNLWRHASGRRNVIIVSIPYERESTSELALNEQDIDFIVVVFQFPTNGKALLNFS